MGFTSMHRPLVRCGLGWTVGTLGGLLQESSPVLVVGMLLCAVVLTWRDSGGWRWAWPVAGVAWGFAVLAIPETGRHTFSEGPGQIVAQTTDVPRATQWGWKVRARGKVPEGEAPFRALELRGSGAPPDWSTGTEVRGRVRWGRSEEASNPGGYRRGTVFLATASQKTLLEVDCQASESGVARLRTELRRMIRAHMTSESGGLAEALLLGDGGGVSPRTRSLFQETGTAHVLSVSGLHLTAGAAAVFWVIQWLLLWIAPLAERGLAGRAASVCAAGMACVHAGFVGSGVATTRALIMVLVGLGARVLGRSLDGPSALGLAALLVVSMDPFSVLSPGFWLSFTAVAGLIVGTHEEGSRASGPLRVFRGSFVAWVVTAPIVAHVFGAVTWGAVGVNVIVVPLVSFLVVPASLSCAILSLVMPDFGPMCMAGIEGLGDALLHTLETLAPFASHVRVPRPSLAWTVACTGSALLLAAPGTRRAAILAMGVLLILCLPSRSGDGKFHLTFFDVRHGDSALLVGPGGEACLVDGGGRTGSRFDVGEQVVVPALDALGIRRLELMVLSHPDADHLLGLLAVARAFPVRTFWWSGKWTSSGPLLGLLAHLHMAGTRVVQGVPPGSSMKLGEIELMLLHPESRRGSDVSTNDESLVLRVQHGSHSFLFTGDVEAYGESVLLERGLDPATVVKAPHHGSRTSSSAPFIAATASEHVVFSGDGTGRHRIPHSEIVARWRDSGVEIHRTDHHGAITFVSDGDDLVWTHHRGAD